LEFRPWRLVTWCVAHDEEALVALGEDENFFVAINRMLMLALAARN
jgi:hypothetical protein